MWLRNTAYRINSTIKLISKWLHSVGLGILLALMLLTFADVCLRYVFNHPIEGSYELTEYMMAFVVGFGIAYCAVLRGHISIEIVVSRLPQRTQVIIEAVTSIITAILFCLITWQYVLQVIDSYHSGRVSVILYIPIYPFIAVVLLGSAALALVLITQFVENLSQAVKR